MLVLSMDQPGLDKGASRQCFMILLRTSNSLQKSPPPIFRSLVTSPLHGLYQMTTPSLWLASLSPRTHVWSEHPDPRLEHKLPMGPRKIAASKRLSDSGPSSSTARSPGASKKKSKANSDDDERGRQ